MLSGDVEVVENIFLNIQYTDMMIPEGSYISNIGYTWQKDSNPDHGLINPDYDYNGIVVETKSIATNEKTITL